MKFRCFKIRKKIIKLGASVKWNISKLNDKTSDGCEVNLVEVLANTEYQDLYRIANGVLVVVNKFIDIYEDQIVRVYDTGRNKRYGHGTQSWLNILNCDQTDWNGVFVPRGTVTYCGIPVKPIKDSSRWNYEIKTTGNSFSGNSKRIAEMLNAIQQILNKK